MTRSGLPDLRVHGTGEDGARGSDRAVGRVMRVVMRVAV
jgi:hypothetical protein